MNASHLFAYGKFHIGWFIDEKKNSQKILRNTVFTEL